MGHLTEEERAYVRELKNKGVFRVFSREDFLSITANGGVGVFCGDGDIDVYNYHQKTITSRSHSVQLFGGILAFTPSFKGYIEGLGLGAVINMGWGMRAKNTRSVFLYPHYPCGVASVFGLTIQEVVALSAEVHNRFINEFSFDGDRVHSLFHVKRINRGGTEEQNTYLFYPELL